MKPASGPDESKAPREIFRFEDFELDRYQLRRSGLPLRLQRLPLELLYLLVERRGELVTREEIIERLWGKSVFVDSENSINTAVRKIRGALNDDADAPRFIITVPARGYRFVAPIRAVGHTPPVTEASSVSAVAEASPSADAVDTSLIATTKAPLRKDRRRGILWSIGGIAFVIAVIVLIQQLSLRPPTTTASIPPAQKLAPPLPDMPSIAVLPLTNMSGDREQGYFSDGITDDLITALSRLPGLFVIARNSSFTYKGKAVGLQDVGKELGVKYVLEGGVRKAGDQVRITVQLADATTGEELWAERYDRPLRDIFALQDEIVRRIVTTLNLQLVLAQRGRFLIPRKTDNLEAYDDVLRGFEYFLSFTKDGNAKARQMYEKAIELDPKYAGAYVGLGSNYFLGWIHLLSSDPNGLERAFQLEQKAIALDESLAGAHSLLAAIYVHKGQYDEAVTEAQRGISLNPNSPFGYLWLAEVMNVTARPAEALVAVEKAMRLDPRNRDYYLSQQGFAYTNLGRYEEAIPVLKRDLVLTNNLWDHVFLVRDYIELGQEDAARAEAAEVERRVALNPSSPFGYLALADVMNNMEEPAQALVAVEKAMRLDPGDPGGYLLVEGTAYHGLGRYEDSITDFKRFVALHPDIFWAHMSLAVDNTEIGHDDAARAEAAEVLRLNPQFNLEMILRTVGPKGKVLADNARCSADLRKAGLK
jgi:TolB-like protein/DNA-binding winged helix-turn-helix (wHTH) protein/cytochrome c-type biogenesis protein CcmH/NrfG